MIICLMLKHLAITPHKELTVHYHCHVWCIKFKVVEPSFVLSVLRIIVDIYNQLIPIHWTFGIYGTAQL